jgi:hypothetical protein
MAEVNCGKALAGEIERLIDNTGVCVPLAAGIVGLVLDSGASDMEARAALKIADSLLINLPISARPEGLRAPCADS